ncbi:hypothetical protein chiPu_0013648 [Chiloscyllium punctatum]|uniref:Uncharacterized protein n=1 Tax=Chiloscyllium punctatum TaxID=137246 RepID=A0A401SXX5_CHIPU|nr:hypothetical protein [Chiloscyllium punctatum]
MDMSTAVSPAENNTTFTQVFGHQCEVMQAAVQSLDTLNEQITYFITNKPVMTDRQDDDLLPEEQDTLKKSLNLMRHLLMDVQTDWEPFSALKIVDTLIELLNTALSSETKRNAKQIRKVLLLMPSFPLPSDISLHYYSVQRL